MDVQCQLKEEKQSRVSAETRAFLLQHQLKEEKKSRDSAEARVLDLQDELKEEKPLKKQTELKTEEAQERCINQGKEMDLLAWAAVTTLPRVNYLTRYSSDTLLDLASPEAKSLEQRILESLVEHRLS